MLITMYKYDTHLHTQEASACATVTGKEQARIYKELGYSGIIVTDHFFGGNTAVKRNLPWKDRIDQFVTGYENAKEEGDKIGLSVFFGLEESFNGTDFLVYGLDKQFLYHNTDMSSWSVKDYYERVKEAGGFFVHAHPFREAFYINEVRLFPEYEDAIEVVNVSHTDERFNKKAMEYATIHAKPFIEGSDAHHRGSPRGGMYFDHKLKDIHDFIKCVKNKEGIIISGKI